MTERDLILQQGVTVSQSFTILNEDNTPLDLTGYTVVFRVYKEAGDADVTGVISGDDNNIVTFELDATVNADLGLFEYRIIGNLPEDPLADPPVEAVVDLELGKGNLYFLPVEGFTTQIPTLIDNESMGLVIPENYETQQILYWKAYLAPAFYIPDELAMDETQWPLLGRFLIAKLVVYDFLVQQMKLSLSTSFGTSSGTTTTTSAGGLKSLQEGPSKAEWYNSSETITNVLKTGANGLSPFDQLRQDICTLAARVKVSLPLCAALPIPTIIPLKASCRRCRCIPNTNSILTYLTD